MTKDDSFTMTPPSKARSKADNAFDEFVRANQAQPETPRPAEQGVQTYGQRATPPASREPTKRLTIDMPESLHKRVRIGSLNDGISVAELVRDFLDRKYPDNI